MADCCEDKTCAIEALQARRHGTLKTVLMINAVMFAVVLVAGLIASSTALLSDSLDNLGDALTYGLSLYAVAKSDRIKSRVAIFKGLLILGAGLFVVGQVVYKMLYPAVPIFEAMGAVGVLALAANATCLFLLWKHRHEDVNMSSVWECSRNDIASNVGVLIAAAGVWLTSTQWPDLLVGALLACLFLASAIRVLKTAIKTHHDAAEFAKFRLVRR
jgi:cation diffusion facilitator family transporter